MERSVGILGGMGPEATVDLMQRIIRLTPALDDGDHVRCIVDNNPKVPSRIRAIIEGDGESPAPVMADMAKRLESWGADFLVIACNTAHYYYEPVQAAVTIPVINMIDLVVKHIREGRPGLERVGMLASTAVAMTGLYTARFEKTGIRDVWPEPEFQSKLLDVIKDVKRGRASEEVRPAYEAVAENLKARGAEIAVIACTELSVLGSPLALPGIDAAQVLAAEIVAICKNKRPLPVMGPVGETTTG